MWRQLAMQKKWIRKCTHYVFPENETQKINNIPPKLTEWKKRIKTIKLLISWLHLEGDEWWPFFPSPPQTQLTLFVRVERISPITPSTQHIHAYFAMALMDCSLFSIISFAHLPATADTSHYGNWNNETNEWTTKTKIDSKETKLKSINYLDKSMNHLCTHSFFLFLFMHRMAERVAIWHWHTQLSARALTGSHSSTLTRSIGRSLACSRRSIKLIIFSNWMRYCVAHCIHYDVITYYSIERLIWKTTEKTEHKMKWTMNDSSVYCQCQTEIWRTINEWIVINPKDFPLPPDLLRQWCSQCSVMRWQ